MNMKRNEKKAKRSINCPIKFIVILTMISLLCIIFTNTNVKADAKTSNVKNFKCITVTEEDTLWSIASENMTEEYNSINEYIDEVMSINELTDPEIYSGATLVVPYYVSVSQ